MWIDTHAHLTLNGYAKDLAEVILRAQQAQIEQIVNICVDEKSLQEGILLHKKHPWIVNTAAVTPHDAHQDQNQFFAMIELFARQKQLVAIGETGLDLYSAAASLEDQKQWLNQHLELAFQANLPVIFHCRNAFNELFCAVDACKLPVKAILHCFTGDLHEAKECLQRGWLISMSGIVTFKNADLLRQVACHVPLESLVLETDAPYLSPKSKRGHVNEPSYLIETAEMISGLKGVSLSTVALATTENARKFFAFQKGA